MSKQTPAFHAKFSALILGSVLLSACSSGVTKHNVESLKQVDTESMTLIRERIRSESRKLLAEQQSLRDELTQVSQPAIQPDPVAPEFNPLDAISVSVSVSNEDVQNVLRALSAQAGMSLLLDPDLADLNRKISMHLTQVPASLVLDKVMALLDLHGEVKSNVLIVRPYQEQFYNLEFLQSAASMDFNIGGDVFGANQTATEGGSSSSMTGNLSLVGAESDARGPYEQLALTLDDLIGKPDNKQDDKEDLPGTEKAAEEDKKKSGKQSVYSLNPMTGTLYVKARPSQITAVTELVERYRSVLQRQVLIEAQILDVSLSDNFAFGIDWDLLRGELAAGYSGSAIALGGVSTNLPNPINAGRSVTLPSLSAGGSDNSLSLVYSNNTFAAALNMLRNFGTVKVLSNPSIRAKNSRPAFISVGRNSRYISEATSVVTNSGGGASTTSTSVTTSSVFNGIMLGVLPFIGSDGKISLTIHPMQSEVQEDSLQLINVGGDSRVTLPVIDFKGITTSLSLNHGDTVILGGLIDESNEDNGDGIPGLRDINGIGALFGNTRQIKSARELVIVLRVTEL